MAITTYCSYDQVRSVLGVSVEEIPDSVIALPLYSSMLSEAFLEVGAAFESNYATVKAVVGPSAAQTRFLYLADAYASYQVALTLLGALPLFAPKDQGDNKTTMARVADPFKNLEASIVQAMNYIHSRLVTSYTGLYPVDAISYAAVTQLNIRATGLAINPVTGA